MAAADKLELVVAVDTSAGNASIVKFNTTLDTMARTAAGAGKTVSGGMDQMSASMAKSAAAAKDFSVSSIQAIEKLEDEVVNLTRQSVALRRELEQHPERHAEINAALQQVTFAQRTARTELRNLSFAQRDANENAQVMASTFGIQLPQAIAKFLTRIPGIQTALSAAFELTVIGAFLTLLSKIPGTIESIADSYAGWTDAARKNYQELINQNQEIIKSNRELAEQQRGIGRIGLSGAALKAAEAGDARINLQATGTAAADAQRAINRLESENAALRGQISPLGGLIPTFGLGGASRGSAEFRRIQDQLAANEAAITARRADLAALTQKQLQLQAIGIPTADAGVRAATSEEAAKQAKSVAELAKKNEEIIFKAQQEAAKHREQQSGGVDRLNDANRERISKQVKADQEFYDGLVKMEQETQEQRLLIISDADEEAAKRAKEAAKQAGDAYLHMWNDFKSQAGSVFDALISRSRNAWDVIGGLFKTIVLTQIRDTFATATANILAPFANSLRGLFGGSGASGGVSLAGALPALGAIGSGVSLPGAPGGTGGFAGPVGSVGALGGLGSFSGFGGGIGAGALGLLVGGPLASIGIGNRIGGSLGGAIGAAGAAASAIGGLGLLTGLGIGAGFGPVGLAIVGAAAGVGALVGLFRKSPEDKVREAIKKTYAVEIRDKETLREIYGIARQYGSIAAGILTPQVRELVELYSLTSGQAGNFPKKLAPVSLMQSGGSIYSLPSFSNGISSGAPMALASGGSTRTQTAINVNLDGAPVKSLVLETVVSANRVISQSVVQGLESSAGRRQMAAQLLSPFELVR